MGRIGIGRTSLKAPKPSVPRNTNSTTAHSAKKKTVPKRTRPNESQKSSSTKNSPSVTTAKKSPSGSTHKSSINTIYGSNRKKVQIGTTESKINSLVDSFQPKLSDKISNPANRSSSPITLIYNRNGITRHMGEQSSGWDNLDIRKNPFTSSHSSPVQLSASQTLASSNRVLSNGSKGEDVAELQRNLEALGYDVGDIDGKFGPKTQAAVRAFQEANGLKVDGIVGKQTITALNQQLEKQNHNTATSKGTYNPDLAENKLINELKIRWENEPDNRKDIETQVRAIRDSLRARGISEDQIMQSSTTFV